jgi:dynein heavy chain
MKLKKKNFFYQVHFDPFSQKEKEQWRRLMDTFYKKVEEIENEAKAFIDKSFQSLRSAEGAFDMLLNFKHIRSREAINNQMMQKFRDILVQYGKEVSPMK